MSSSSSKSEQGVNNEDCDAASENLHTDSGDEDILVVNSVVNPYENEPLASAVGQHFVSVEEDADGINPETLEARFERTVTLDKWYVTKHCECYIFQYVVVNKYNIF